MAIDATGLIALKGNLILGVKTVKFSSMKDLVRLEKVIKSGIYDESYDMNSDGVLDDTDVALLTNYILDILFP